MNRNIEIFEQGYNCAQAVILGQCEELGLSLEQAAKVAELFGGGLSGLRTDVCGAVAGALMLLGLKYGRTAGEDTATKESAGELGRAFLAKMTEKFGSIRCGELVALAEKRDPSLVERKGKHMPLCQQLVSYAAEEARRMIGE